MYATNGRTSAKSAHITFFDAPCSQLALPRRFIFRGTNQLSLLLSQLREWPQPWWLVLSSLRWLSITDGSLDSSMDNIWYKVLVSFYPTISPPSQVVCISTSPPIYHLNLLTDWDMDKMDFLNVAKVLAKNMGFEMKSKFRLQYPEGSNYILCEYDDAGSRRRNCSVCSNASRILSV